MNEHIRDHDRDADADDDGTQIEPWRPQPLRGLRELKVMKDGGEPVFGSEPGRCDDRADHRPMRQIFSERDPDVLDQTPQGRRGD